MPSFSDLKEKAIKAKDASVDRYHKTRDNTTSVSMKSTNWDPYSTRPTPSPPPPPARKPSALSSFRPPPSRTNSISPANSSGGTPSPVAPPPGRPPPLPSRTPSTDSASASQARTAPPTIVRATKPVKPSPSLSPSPSPGLPPLLPKRSSDNSSPAAPHNALQRPSSYLKPSSGLTASPNPSQEIDWTNLSTADKQEFFRWLDEFFTGYLGRPIGPASQ